MSRNETIQGGVAYPVTVHGIVLAAGLSDRFGPGNKLSQLVGDRSIIWRTVSAYTESRLASTVIVLPPGDSALESLLDGLEVSKVINPKPRLGMGNSLRMGVEALPADAAAAVIGVADQPLLQPAVIDSLVNAWRRSPERVVAPLYAGRPGNPTVFGAECFEELGQVSGDKGGREVRDRHDCRTLNISPPWIGLDVDTESDLLLANEKLAGYVSNSNRRPSASDPGGYKVA